MIIPIKMKTDPDMFAQFIFLIFFGGSIAFMLVLLGLLTLLAH